MRPPSRKVARATFRLHCEPLEGRDLPAGLDLLAIAPFSGPPVVRVLDAATGDERFRIDAFGRFFGGGVRVAVGDVTGDGVQDVVCASGPGDRPLVRVFSGTDGAPVRELSPYDVSFRGGVTVAVGDVNNDGLADIITGRGRGHSAEPPVKVFSGADGSLLQSFDVTGARFAGGVNVAAGDVNGDNRADVIIGQGLGGTSTVTVFSGASGKMLRQVDAFGRFFRGGVTVAAGDVDGDGRAEVIAGTAYAGRTVRVFDGGDGSLRGQFFGDAAGYRCGLQVSTTYANNDGRADIVVSGARGGVSVRDGLTFAELSRVPAEGRSMRAVAAGAALKDGDVVLDANTVALKAIRDTSTAPPRASRLLAMVHAAVYDAVNGILGGHAAYLSGLPAAPAGASAEAAAAAAAYRVLSSQLPGQQALFDRFLNGQLAVLPAGAARDDGEGFGRAVADKLLAARADDGSDTVVSYVNGAQPGEWRPTPAAFAPAALPNWPLVTPFAMTGGAQFRPAGPPDLTSARYAAEYNEVKSLGSVNSSTRTAEQTEIALFWADGAGTVTPPGHWNQIGRDLALRHGLSLAETARLFALINIAMADAAIAAWDAKYAVDGGYGRWRPVTGIREGDNDGNPDTAGDPTWAPLIATPPFPAYTSGHSTFSGAAAAVLKNLFGGEQPFLTHTDALADVARRQAGFTAAAQEAAVSRLYGGIHWRSDNDDGFVAGTALGNYVFQNFLK